MAALTQQAPTGAPRETLLILSDVHLGSDINDRAPVEARPRRSKRVDDDLVALFRHYAAKAPPSERWRAVIAGDFVDFIGMSVRIDSVPDLATLPDDEERAHGLGNASDHAREKMRRVVTRHREVLAALAEFVDRGHALTMVHGNHDIEFHWDAVREEMKSALARLARERAESEGRAFDDAAFLGRIEFNPWFFYADGVAYVEHGHQYDAFCATEYVMAPLSPLDPRRIARGFSEVFLRYVVHSPFGMKEHGHDGRGMGYYITFALGLGVRGLIGIARAFVGALLELFRLRRAHFTDAGRRLREEHERRVALLAEATRVGADRLRALMALQVPPIARSIRGILASVLLDRLALALFTALALLVVAVASWNHGQRWWAAAIVLGAWAFTNRHLEKQRKIDPDAQLVERASHLARLFPAAFVVMGHTHVPMRVPVDGGATYINVGSWAEEEEESEPRAARTHLVIHPAESGPVAELLAWDSTAAGPRAYRVD